MSGPPDLHQTPHGPAAEPPFHDELTEVWGGRWGASDEVGPLRRSSCARPGDELGADHAPTPGTRRRRRSWTPTAAGTGPTAQPPDLDAVHAQHAGLVAALEREGVEVVRRRAARPRASPRRSTSRDPLVTIPGGAVIGRMAVRDAPRRGGRRHAHVAGQGLPILHTITGTGTLEGGSFVKLARAWRRSARRSAATRRARCSCRTCSRASAGSCSIVPLQRLHDPPRPAPGDGRRRPRAGRRPRAAVLVPRGARAARHRDHPSRPAARRGR